MDRKHWARGTGQVWLKLSATGKRALEDRADLARVYYGQGPLLAPGGYAQLPPYESLAKYSTAIARHGARPETMIGTTAIARGTFGHGRVICFSPHPEATGGPNNFIRVGVRWAASGRPATGLPAGTREIALAPTSLVHEQGITPAGAHLGLVLDGMDVEHHWLPGIRVHWRSGEPTQPRHPAATHCQRFCGGRL